MKFPILTILIAVFLSSFSSLNEKYGNDERDYFSKARFNKSPKNIKFLSLISSKEHQHSIKDKYIVMYTKDFNDEGVYIKCYYDNEVKLTKVEYFSFDNDIKTETALKQAFKYADTSCEVKCDREKGCYDKPTEGGVLLCAFECMMSCM